MRLPLVAMLAGCAFHARAAGDAAGSGGALVDDDASDFSQLTWASELAIDPQGRLEPLAYVLGGLRARAYDGKHVTGTTASWADIETEVAGATARGTAYQQLPANWMGGHPTGLGLSAAAMPDDNFTVLYDGEVLIPAGDHTLDIDADDAGAIELDPDGRGYQMFTVDASAGVKTISVHAGRDTWMGLHLAIGEGTGNSQLVARLDGTALTAAQTRALASFDHGLLTWIYYGVGAAEVPAGPVAVATPNVDWGMTAPPFDLPGVPTSYTARFLGQLRIEQTGTYTLATSTGNADDSSALYLDGHLVSRTAQLTDPHPTSATLPLTAGWHSIVVELSGSQKNLLNQSDPHAVTLATTIAPEGGPPVPITADMLRPAAATGYLGVAFTASTFLNDTNIASGVTALGLAAPSPTPPVGAVVDSTTIGYVYRNATSTDYTVSLDMAGTSLAIPSTSDLVLLAGDETGAGKPEPTAAGAWTYTFTDTVPGNATGHTDQSAFGFAVYTTHGGPQMPFAPVWTFQSLEHLLEGVTAFGPFTVTGQLAGATLVASVRSAATSPDLEAAPWVDVASGAVPAIEPHEFVQYRLVVTGDGWQFPTIDKVELDYAR